MKLRFFASVGLFALTAVIVRPAVAQSVPAFVNGNIGVIWADPSDVVLGLNVNGPCDSNFFHIKRGTTNFSEFVAIMYTAAAARRPVSLWVTNCAGDRNVVGHGSAIFN